MNEHRRRRVAATLLAAVVFCIAVASALGGTKATPGTVTAAYKQWTLERFPGAQGYWTCPIDQQYARLSEDGYRCVAEVYWGTRVHRLDTIARVSPSGSISFPARLGSARSNDRQWVRKWTPYSADVIKGFNVPGVASVNAPGQYDWSFIAGFAHDGWRKHERTFKAWSVDGPGDGFDVVNAFYSFRCKVSGILVTCTNAVGDAIRYRPRTG